MRDCEAPSCLSVLGADRHRKGQTCVSMAMSGCSPFPLCWDRGMNEISSKHTLRNMQQGARDRSHTAWHLTPLELELVYRESYQFLQQTVCLYMSASVCVCICVHSLTSPPRCNYLPKRIHFLLMEDKHRKEGREAEQWNLRQIWSSAFWYWRQSNTFMFPDEVYRKRVNVRTS